MGEMTVTTRDIFGGSGAEAATAGSYGEPARNGSLPDATHLGEVRLQITDLERSLQFYEHVLGLRVLERDAARAALAAHGDDHVLVELTERRDGKPVPRKARLGLYHFAILLPDRASLGRFVRHLTENGIGAGAGDHLVSEAFYLSDPDGLGIEVYADRPRSTWRRAGRQLMMATDPVDTRDVAAAAGETRWEGMPVGTVMGHVHLHTGDLEAAARFYSDGIGFDRIVWSYPGALFMSAGGYHHHLGTNTWAGSHAHAAADDEARLLEWTIVVPTSAAVAAVEQRLRAGGYDIERAEEGVSAADPWGTRVRIRASAM
jgi:catechol 2,3-dioxygenase